MNRILMLISISLVMVGCDVSGYPEGYGEIRRQLFNECMQFSLKLDEEYRDNEEVVDIISKCNHHSHTLANSFISDGTVPKTLCPQRDKSHEQ